MVSPIILVHDSTASRISFVELTFGLNLAFATYEKFRVFIKNLLDKNLEEYIAQAIAAETEGNINSHQDRVNELKNKIRKIGRSHMDLQWKLCLRVRLASIVMSVICLGVLCFDLLDCFGNYIAALISPLPIYVLLSLLLFVGYRIRAWFIKRQYIRFIQTFEKCPAAEIKQGLKTLDYDEDTTEDT